MQIRSKKYWHAALGWLVVFSLGTTGCNMFGGVDHPGDAQDKYSAAVALANAGLCSDAVTLLNTIANPTDDVAVALGWAQLCVGGATAGIIATSIYKFNSGSSDLTSVGILARAMLPMTGDKSQALGFGVSAFNLVQDTNRKSLESGIGSFAQAAGILASQAGNDGFPGLVQTDISPAGCAADAANCAASTNCVQGPSGMSDTDVQSFTTAINNAAADLGNSGAANLQALANALKAGLPGGAGALVIKAERCFIFNSAVPNP